ncbi:hypothetical protein EN850_03105 [Mesorhizobium sp. M8A.F.Ca.ET.207.01.1.1]|uniref:hypothetical protein n=1 Tax=Mesorhizobium sp. M8A.F.Ca.ET.207.01.1.1 TaxID=2563968 RepID=UPI00109C6063|nr:hypothetical protein [Mesorhizobium sp. M8A.F.Ca.ET.207.01.1.1]TGQ83746.1 hypothetical protein EN850_03105 [Mesorhizobium sp. M8A.F.Ca.ET.207.01.1.1]
MSALLNHVHVPAVDLPNCIGKTRSPDGLRSGVFRITPALAKRHGIQPMLILGTKDGSVALGVIRGDATELSFTWSEDPELRHQAVVKPGRAVLLMLECGGAA